MCWTHLVDRAECKGDLTSTAVHNLQYWLQVQGQVADLTDLQRILQRSEQKLSNAQQQNMTVGCLLMPDAKHKCVFVLMPMCCNHATCNMLQRWAVYSAATMLTKYKKEYQALQDQMQQRASVDKCVAAIEQS